MKTKNKHFKNIIQWILAAALAFVLANILIIPYWYAPGWTSRDSGATPAIYHAGKTVINGHEGYGWAHVDERGYLNEDKPLADEVVLVMGCSHTKAIEVPMNKRYTSLLNDKLSGGDDSKLYVYNMAIDGFYFPQIVEGFKAALEEIPSVTTVVIEIPSTEYAPTDFDFTSSRSYSASATGSTAFSNQGLSSKLQTGIKELFPLTSLYLSKQFVSDSVTGTPFLQANPVSQEKFVFPPGIYEDYHIATEAAFQELREYWDGEIYVIYHPNVHLTDEGQMAHDNSISIPWFFDLAGKYNIITLGMGGVWLNAYNTEYIVPYGFANTAPGQGHLNEDGHRMIADLLYTVLEGGDNS